MSDISELIERLEANCSKGADHPFGSDIHTAILLLKQLG